jgi:hypothetical protein
VHVDALALKALADLHGDLDGFDTERPRRAG